MRSDGAHDGQHGRQPFRLLQSQRAFHDVVILRIASG